MKDDRLFMKVRLMRPSSILPARATQGSAGYDLHADLEAPLTIAPGEALAVPSGVAVALPEGTVGLVFGRSGLGTRFGVAPANAVGVVDRDFRGEIVVTLRNQSGRAYEVSPGDRVAQLVVTPILCPELCQAESLDETERGGGGWGSTGK